ncbi:MAG: Icc-related predicted phosphoesterase [Patescibacteria group bacterium]|jgi:Icc-related predicted phosphoesterase
MVKILAASDLHGSLTAAIRLSKKALENNVDVIILAGDLNGNQEGDLGILEPFNRENQKVLFIPGNWDTTLEHENQKQGARSIHKKYVTYEDVGIAGIGSPDMKMELTDNDFLEIKNQFQKMKTSKTVLVGHLHAQNTKAEFSGIPGDARTRKAIEYFQPDIFLAGHIHEAEGIEDKIGKTQVFQIGRNGKVFEL